MITTPLGNFLICRCQTTLPAQAKHLLRISNPHKRFKRTFIFKIQTHKRSKTLAVILVSDNKKKYRLCAYYLGRSFFEATNRQRMHKQTTRGMKFGRTALQSVISLLTELYFCPCFVLSDKSKRFLTFCVFRSCFTNVGSQPYLSLMCSGGGEVTGAKAVQLFCVFAMKRYVEFTGCISSSLLLVQCNLLT